MILHLAQESPVVSAPKCCGARGSDTIEVYSSEPGHDRGSGLGLDTITYKADAAESNDDRNNNRRVFQAYLLKKRLMRQPVSAAAVEQVQEDQSESQERKEPPGQVQHDVDDNAGETHALF